MTDDWATVISGRVADYNRSRPTGGSLRTSGRPRCSCCAHPVLADPAADDTPIICTSCAGELHPLGSGPGSNR